jgi:putative hydroxymethylpyrimidine transport system substrate-binding protein
MAPRWLIAVSLAVAAVLVPAAAAGPRHVTVTLDWTPNPDHVGLYYSRDAGLFATAGLDVAIHAPSDPTATLKLVALGKSDLAVSYEQEVFYAVAKKLPIVAVAAVVPQPLNSIMAIDPKVRRIADLRGKTIGITGVPSDNASLDTALSTAGLRRSDVKVVTVGYNLLPALLAHRVAAVIGVYRNVEGIELERRGLKPTIIPLDRAGVPFYDELVLVASSSRLHSDPTYADTVRRFVKAFRLGTTAARAHPARSLAILRKATAGDAGFLAKATPATLALLAGTHGVGCMRTTEWTRFGAWMHARGLVKHPIAGGAVMTTRFLPPSC